tara:strand:+ start:283 stop:618 length:336 start_codon:yes stop_codon:yes gene_type:complete
MTNFTEMEIIVLNILAKNHIKYGDGAWYDEDGYAHPDTFELSTDGTGECGTIFSKNNLDPKVYRGVIGSLHKKGALIEDEYSTSGSRGFQQVPMIAITISKSAFNEIKAAA